jgi:hypothetical protein
MEPRANSGGGAWNPRATPAHLLPALVPGYNSLSSQLLPVVLAT